MSGRNINKELAQMVEIFGADFDQTTLRDILIESRSVDDAINRLTENPEIAKWKSNSKKKDDNLNNYSNNNRNYSQRGYQQHNNNRNFQNKDRNFQRNDKWRHNNNNDHSNNSNNYNNNNKYYNKGPQQIKRQNFPAQKREQQSPQQQINAEIPVERTPPPPPAPAQQPQQPRQEDQQQQVNETQQAFIQPVQVQPSVQTPPPSPPKPQPTMNLQHLNAPEHQIYIPTNPINFVPIKPHIDPPLNGSLLSLPSGLRNVTPNFELFGNFVVPNLDQLRQYQYYGSMSGYDASNIYNMNSYQMSQGAAQMQQNRTQMKNPPNMNYPQQ